MEKELDEDIYNMEKIAGVIIMNTKFIPTYHKGVDYTSTEGMDTNAVQPYQIDITEYITNHGHLIDLCEKIIECTENISSIESCGDRYIRKRQTSFLEEFQHIFKYIFKSETC